jgi:glycosyltransferase involved in cell wall biosynthesis
MSLSVIICTNNPRLDYISRVLEALRAQSLSSSEWELVLVDNASRIPLEGSCDLSWHPQARCIVETELGASHARWRAVRETRTDIRVFVDDDNLLSPDYLETAVRLLETHPWLGAIGGQIFPEYEVSPPEWLTRYERVLAIRRFKKMRWSNAADDWQSQPWGAGMVLRKSVCEVYDRNMSKSSERRALGRKGSVLGSAEDIDLILGCLDVGLGFGTFPELVVTHLIPERRMTEASVASITRAMVTSNLLLSHLRGEPTELSQRPSLYTHLRGFYHFLKMSSIDRRFAAAVEAGQQDFQVILNSQRASQPDTPYPGSVRVIAGGSKVGCGAADDNTK